MAQQLRNQTNTEGSQGDQRTVPTRILSSSRPLVAPATRIIKQVSQEERDAGSSQHKSTYHVEIIDNRVTASMMQAAQERAQATQKFDDQVARFKKLVSELPYNKLLYFIGLVVGAGFLGATNEFCPEYLIVTVSLASFIMFFALKV